MESSSETLATPLNTDTCATGPTLVDERPGATLAGSDDKLVDTNSKQVGIWVQPTGWQLLYRSECCLSNARFVAQDLVGVVRLDLDLRRHFLLLNLRGEVLLDDAVDAGYQFGSIVPSANARTAAVVFSQRDISSIETGIEINSTRAKIAFYDLVAHKKIAHLDVDIPGDHLFGFAISPDSKGFALLNGTKLSVYDLPGAEH